MAGARDDHPHLPPGHEPGAQSRRAQVGRRVGGCATASGEGDVEVGLVCTEHYDVLRRYGTSDSRSRVTDSAPAWQAWVAAPQASLRRRVE